MTLAIKLAVVLSLILLVSRPVRAQVSIDATSSANQGTPSSTASTAAFSTRFSNELLLAFISTDYLSGANTAVTGVSGGGLTWTLVVRTNVQSGTSEIWRAFAASTLSNVAATATLSQSVLSSMTVMSFSGVDTSGTNGSGAIGATGTGNANAGAPIATLTTTRNGSFVVGVGNDFDNAIPRTVGPNQVLINQYLVPVGDTYWVQTAATTTPLSGTVVTINDTAPTGDRYNLSICEILTAPGAGPTYTLSGNISAAAAGGTVTLQNGASNTTTTADGFGNYIFTNLANGTYTVTPAKNAYTFTPTSRTVTISGADLPNVNFMASTAPTWTISGTISPPANGSSATVTLSGGTSNTVVTADGSGNYTFTNVPNGSYTVTPNKSGYTFSPSNRPVTVSGSDVPAINFTAQLATSWSISGTISPALGSSITLTLSGSANATVVSDTAGNYKFSGLANGSYTVTPSKTGENFSPSNRSVTISGADVARVDFTASPAATYSVFGSISPLPAGSGVLVTLSGTISATATTDSSGNYLFSGVPNGGYTVMPSKAGFTFSPTTQSFAVANFDANPINFTILSVPTWSISGTITPASAGRGALLTLSGGPGAIIPADSSGNYAFNGLSNGAYTVTPRKTGYTFVPASQTVTITNGDVPEINFAGQAGPPSPLNYPDFTSLIPTTAMSIVQVGGSRQLQYTHEIFNGGTGPLEILPVYNPASGSYQGFHRVYSVDAFGNWNLAQTIPIAGKFVYHPEHGHFHFPMASWGLYQVNPDGSPGAPVAMSAKIGFCINDSFISDPFLPNAGAFSNWGSCADPTSRRGLSIGAVDEYDQSDFDQNIILDGVPDGTYWFRSIVDPNNFLAESDKTNNETDVKIVISGDTVQALQTVYPVLSPPPNITLTAPSNGSTIAGTVQLTATTVTGGSGVQFLVDGNLLGAPVPNPPYAIGWNTGTVPDGTHWLAAQTMDSTGRTGTSPVAVVTVSNGGQTAPTVQVTSPAGGSTVSGIVSISADAASSTSIKSVQFFVDGSPAGGPITTPPYMTTWDTRTATAGTHMLSASATDSAGLIGNSPSVAVTVDNSHPPNVIGMDVTVSSDGNGTIQTPSFSTAQSGDLLIAFMAYDGPANSAQTASISGGGLNWTLLKRSNSQAGTAEIWAAKAAGTLSSVTVLAQPGTGSYDGSLTVIAFSNASGAGVVGQAAAPSGAPDIYLPGVSAGNWVFAVGNDWDQATARMPVDGQVIVHQWLDTAPRDTFWVQSTTAPSTINGLVDIHDSTPTTDRWNYAAVEIVATH